MVRNAHVIPYTPSTNEQLAIALGGFGDMIKRATEASLSQNPDWEEYTETEKRAMILIGSLRNVNGVDLMAMELRYTYIQEIERTNALTAHPEHYSTLSDMASEQGISIAELSKIKDLCGIVFPYLQNTLGRNIAEMWENVGKSRFFEVLPALKVLITNTASETTSVNESVDLLIGDAVATNVASGIQVVDDEAHITNPETQITQEGVRAQVIENILVHAETLPVRELRRTARPVRTAPVPALIVRSNGTRYLMAKMDAGQLEMIQRILANHLDLQTMDLPEDPAQRQDVLFRRREFRDIYTLAGE